MSIAARLRTLLGGSKPLIPREPVVYRPIGVVRNRIREHRLDGWQDVRSDIILRDDLAAALDGIEGFSHVIVVFHFDRLRDEGIRPLRVRIGGEGGREVGVLASRHPPRPNSIGVSVVEVIHRRQNALRVRGLDALDGTPVLDLKPYVPPYDAITDARLPAWASEMP